MTLLSNFHDAILANDARRIAGTIKPHPHLKPEQQFSVYSEGYRIRLLQAVRSDYPILLRLIAEKNFDTIARNYIEQNPPKNYNLDLYPHKFAKFFADYYDDKFATEVAILEGCIAEVFMLPDSAAFTADSLSGISPENFGNTVLKPRIASRLLQFSYPASDWLTLARAENNFNIPQAATTWLLVVRHDNEVQRHDLSAPEFTLLENLYSGKKILEALEVTVSKYPSQEENIVNNMQKWFENWIRNGAFSL